MLFFAIVEDAISPIVLLLAALAIDAAIGDPPFLWRRIPHPITIIGKMIAFLERSLNRPSFSSSRKRIMGAIATLGLTGGAVLVGVLVSEIRLHVRWGWVLEIALIWALLAQKSLYLHVRDVAVALEGDDLGQSRIEIAKIVGRDPERLNQPGIARAAIESLFENFSDAVVAPVFWYVLFGAPGILALKTVNTLDSMIGRKNSRYLDFGRWAARLDDIMMLVPARLSGLLLTIAARFTSGCNAKEAFRIMMRDHGHHASPNSGWPEAAGAGALGLALAGPRHYKDHDAIEPWIGDGRSSADFRDVGRALSLMAKSCLLLFTLIFALFFLSLILTSSA